MVAKKLIYKLTVLAIVPVILSMVVFGSVSYEIYKEQLIKERIEEATFIIDLSSEEIKNPLYFLELNRLNDIINNIKKNPDVLSVFILDSRGRVITDGTPENRYYNQSMDDNFSKKSIRSKVVLSEINKDMLQVSAPIIIKEKIGILLIDFSLDELDMVLINLMNLLGMIGVVVIAVVAAVDFSITSSISKPVVELRNAADAIAKGNFEARTQVMSEDEIGELAGSFNKMARDLQRSSDENRLAEEQIKKSLKEKEVLLREIHHRVKNNMQIISSLLMLQSQYLKDKKDADIFIDSQNRIESMSLVHEKLYQTGDLARIDFKEYIEDMVSGLFQSYGVDAGNIALNINVEHILLTIDSAIPCGLIINELVTNSLKHAFPEGRDGEIKVVLRSTDENTIELLVGDNGIGIPADIDFRKTESLGLHLVTILAENQLNGGINLDRSNGTEFQIRFRVMK